MPASTPRTLAGAGLAGQRFRHENGVGRRPIRPESPEGSAGLGSLRRGAAVVRDGPASLHGPTTLEIVDIRLTTPDIAVVSCIKTVHDERADADVSTALPSTGALTYVMTKTEGSWRIALAQTTPILA